MDIYLPIAEISINAWIIMAMGLGVGFLSGMFGVGGGFLTTPLLIFYGIPPAIAVASSTTQIAGASVSGALAYWRRGGIDFSMGVMLILGGICGSFMGSYFFRWMQSIGQVDTIVSIIYVLLLGVVGSTMLRDIVRGFLTQKATGQEERRINRHSRFVAALPFRMRFRKSGLYLSPLAPFLLGLVVGVLTMIMGVGGGFILVPAMIYVLGMPASVVIGTSLFQIIFVASVSVFLHAVETQTVDIVLGVLLLTGGVIGAQFGVRVAQKVHAQKLRFALALLVLGVSIRLFIGLTWKPSEIFTVQIL